MQRWALLVEYDGGGFSGWQRQGTPDSQLLTGQAVLEDAAAKLTGGLRAPATVAGRTDAGVHAEGQVVLIALPPSLDARQVRDALNFHMKPHPIVVRRAAPAPDAWNPRFSALSRRYRYRILNRAARPGLDAGRVWHVPTRLDSTIMQHAADRLLGQHDFTSFRAAACQATSPIRTLDRLHIHHAGDIVEITAEARSFLHHQVRNIVGTLKLVGTGHWTADDVSGALAARTRSAAGPTAPPDGLCLLHVAYERDPFT